MTPLIDTNLHLIYPETLNYPEGLRAGYQLRGFETGNARFPLSDQERVLISDIRSRIACVLADCGFSEAAHACVNNSAATLGDSAKLRNQVEDIVRSVMATMKNKG